jgi:hypothetical protein
MKTIVGRLISLVVLMLTVATLGSWCQALPGVIFKASTPFTAGETKFPAGTYIIRQEPDSQTEWQISNEANDHSAFFSTEPGDANTSNQKSDVTFQKYGDNLVLKAFSVAGVATNYVVQTSYAEKKASKAGSPTKVSVPAQKK